MPVTINQDTETAKNVCVRHEKQALDYAIVLVFKYLYSLGPKL